MVCCFAVVCMLFCYALFLYSCREAKLLPFVMLYNEVLKDHQCGPFPILQSDAVSVVVGVHATGY